VDEPSQEFGASMEEYPEEGGSKEDKVEVLNFEDLAS
jgi:hypothetical protein